MKFLRGKKTYIVAGLAILTGLFNVIMGDMTIAAFFQSPDIKLVFDGLIGSTIRAGISNG